jgi:indolepyruvate ferredoxin oxidoreductase
MSATSLARPGVTLADRYAASDGEVLLSGIQALVRLTLEQRRLDRRRGLDTAVFVSGYQGSPLGGLDRELLRVADLLEPAGVVFRPGLNEELAATAVAGTQLLGQLERRRHAGVTGFWFGKNPGLDRAADAIRHGNVSGTAPLGGAVAWIGDDPSSKSSTIPSSCEPICRSLLLPLLAPGSVAELLTLGLHAVALSRHAGLWCGMKIVADIADASAVVRLDGLGDAIPRLAPRAAASAPILLPPTNLDAELELMDERLARAREYAELAQVNRVVFEPRRPRLAVVAAGMGHQAVLRACERLGLDAPARDALGLRIVQLGMPWPLGRAELRRLLADVETVLVVEDKLPFVESQIRDLLYRSPDAPLVLGKEDAAGRPLLSARSALGADEVASALGRVIGDERLPARARQRLEQLAHVRGALAELAPLAKRTPYFCSGCPHNSSTRAQPDQLVGAGIGCHIMVAIDGGDRRGQLLGMPQMGGEGAQWLGLEPFTDDEHFIQNLGDGTFHHSGSLAIRAAVAAGVRMTYRLLYNDAVAMTGGQQPQGKLDVPALTRWLALEGVRRIVVTSAAPETYRAGELDPIAELRHRDDLQAAQAELEQVDGVTVLLHVDRCATEERRMRKRGQATAPAERVWINERVCEGCGDCGEASTCLSVQPVETDFGRKTRIHQGSCNQDFSCLRGDCPSFLLVTPEAGRATTSAPALPVALSDPVPRVPRDVLVRMPGVGGTGVVTVSQILQMAAHLDGRFAAGLEQIGLAQKGGPVLSDVRISDTPIDGALRADAASADVLLGLDLLGAAAPETLAVADPARTVAVLNTAQVPTARMVTDTHVQFPTSRRPLRRVEAVTRAGELVALDAQALAEQLFGDSLPANMLLVGAAFQHGCLPLSADAIQQAIRINGAAVETNLAAFAWGRAAVLDADAVSAALAPAPLPSRRDPGAVELVAPLDLPAELRELVERRAGELIAFQDAGCARRYAVAVAELAAAERRLAGPSSTRVTEAYARGLHKLIAYKDEYEVARLHVDPVMRAERERAFGADAKVQILLHPPLLRALGMKRKLKLGAWAFPALRALAALRRLRGTRLDPFGRAEVRRVERALPGEYRALVAAALERLTPGTVAEVAEIAALPDMIRGYEQIKLRNVAAFRTRAQELLAELERAAGIVTEAQPVAAEREPVRLPIVHA